MNGIQVARLCAANPVSAEEKRAQGTLDLRHRDLTGADLSSQDLRDCNFRGATLRNCTLRETNLAGSDFSEADLRGANLETAHGLEAWQFRATDVRDAKLPKEIADWKGLDLIGKLAPALSQQFLVLLAACLYCWLVIAATTDAALVLGSATQALPILQARISIQLFYGAAPFLVFVAFVYFLLNLHLLWEALAKLPAMFPDGRRLDERAYPWPLVQKVRAHYERLRSRKDYGLVPRFEIWLGSAIAYGAAPVTLGFFWTRSLVKHSAVLTGWSALLVFFGILMAGQFHAYSSMTLDGDLPDAAHWFRRSAIKRYGWYLAAAGILWAGSSYGVQNMRALLFGAALSTQPEGWVDGQPDLTGVKGAQLSSADLRRAVLEYAFLAKADLSSADLREADLTMADLRNANLTFARLDGARLIGARLEGAHLAGAQGLTRRQLELAKLDERTLLPSEFADLVRRPKPAK
ncbi:MAG TPA: pentapeptide repeat-containing protein [Bryobacteraceae bacterium]|nr:pentapeptide repeat-containing protein [Bryobacteraceae bacterium]